MSQKYDFKASLPIYNLKPQGTQKNICIIFDVRTFHDGLDVLPRNDALAKKDLENMKNLFQNLNFKVALFLKPPTRENIGREITQRYKVDDFKKIACIVVVVLSKGIKDYFIAQDGMFKMEWVWGPFILNPDLKGKPKLFIFQMEEIKLPGDDLQTDDPDFSKGSDVPPECKEKVPEGHMMYIHYRIPEKVSDTIPSESRFSKIMLDCFTNEKTKEKHIGEVMAMVNNKLAMSSSSLATSSTTLTTTVNETTDTDAVNDANKQEESEENKKVKENKLKPWNHEVPSTVSHLPSLLYLHQ
jgi:hypothetical protein